MRRKFRMIVGATGFLAWMLTFLWLFTVSTVNFFTCLTGGTIWGIFWAFPALIAFWADFFGGWYFYYKVAEWVGEEK